MGTAAPSPSSRVLVVASDPETRTRVREALAGLPLRVEEAPGAAEALAAAQKEPPDLFIADMLLRDLTGIGFCRVIRENPALARASFLLVSAFDHEMDRILAFEAGADDFVAKPFYKRELASRVTAILRRLHSRGAGGAGGGGAVDAGPVRLDAERGRLEVEGRAVDLTPKEFEIFRVLVRNEGRVLSRERIVHDVWGRPMSDARVVDAHIKSIRRKLGDASDALETVRGVGFRFSGGRDRAGLGGGGNGRGTEPAAGDSRRPRPRAGAGAAAQRNSG